MTERRILIVTNAHPPCPGAAGTRWTAMTHHLRRMGHAVTVVASDAWGRLPDDDENGVIRVTDVRSVTTLRRLFRRGELPFEGGTPVLERPPTALLTRTFVPDMHVVTWLPRLQSVVRRLVAQREIDCLITTSPPESTHLVGLFLGAGRPAWIADFRDGWNFEPWRERFPTRGQRLLDRLLERRVIGACDFAVGVTRPIADDLEHRLGASAVWIPNGWDSRLEPPSASRPPAATSRAVTLVYTGTLSGPWGRSPESLLMALSLLRREPGLPHVRLVHAGRLTTEERDLIDRSGVGDAYEHLGVIERPEALALQRSADALVLITSRNTSEATSKIFEYLAAGRPILALAIDNEAARIVEETGTGIAVPPDDVDAICTALRRIATGDAAKDYAPASIERFTYPGLAESMAGLVDEAIERRRPRHTDAVKRETAVRRRS